MKNIVVGLIIIILIGGAAYFFTKKGGATASDQQAQTQQTQATTTDQVQGQELKVGTGKEATPGAEVSVLYEGRLQNGTVFDSSASHDNKPLVFTLGTPGIIPGFQIGVNGMKEGGERMILVPPSLGYGAQVVGSIPANSSLIFDVKLVKVVPSTTTPAKAN